MLYWYNVAIIVNALSPCGDVVDICNVILEVFAYIYPHSKPILLIYPLTQHLDGYVWMLSIQICENHYNRAHEDTYFYEFMVV
mgnify:CR=1 FL=1